MIYTFVERWQQAWAPAVAGGDVLRRALEEAPLAPLRVAGASLGLAHDAVRVWPKPAFAIPPVPAGARGAAGVDARGAPGQLDDVDSPDEVDEQVLELPLSAHAFVALRRFVRRSKARPLDRPAQPGDLPVVLLVAPLSGNHATLLRDTVVGLVVDHDVVVTDWRSARDVPLAAGDFGLDDQIGVILEALGQLWRPGAPAHLVAVCQPGVAALSATARLCEDGAPHRPASLTLIGSPIDGRINPMLPNRVAAARSLASFRRDMISTVPRGAAGAGRRVYAGWLQHQAFLWMKPTYHLDKHLDHLRAAFVGDAEAMATHDAFYAEFRAVMDLTERFYLDTIERVFQRFELARGEASLDGRPLRPATIVDVPLLVVEGERDDITGPGQTAAAFTLTSALPAALRRHRVQEGVGHYGLFSGTRWRQGVLPELTAFVADAAAGAVVRADVDLAVAG